MLFIKHGLKWARTLLLILVIVSVGISTVSFTSKLSMYNEMHPDIRNLTQSISDIHSTLKVDSIRQYKIEKILKIFNRYNKQIPFDKKIEIANEIYQMSLKYSNLDIDLICATITHESARSWDPNVVSFAGAMGLMQIMPATGIFLSRDEGIKWTSADEILFDPILNIRLGCRYLSSLIHSYDVDGGLAAYNGGEERAALWLKHNRRNDILWEETRGYVPAVLKLYEKFQQDNGIL
ncbi:transglycosylase SLT domain-containing protein [candidate division KSB1 bacterium]|nr:transglycosylase SLT domain-containing protein [candidate division KSB1 bacterium]